MKKLDILLVTVVFFCLALWCQAQSKKISWQSIELEVEL
jgi:hypothetical protein